MRDGMGQVSYAQRCAESAPCYCPHGRCRRDTEGQLGFGLEGDLLGNARLSSTLRILRAVYVMLSTGADYRELGAAYLDASDARRIAGNLIRRLERLGHDVTLTPRQSEPATGLS
jgi:hypothetical protein